MRVALFGGTFDPPHRGHLAVARVAGSRFSLDRILFAPTGRQPLKPEGSKAGFADRLAMVRLLCGAEPTRAGSARLEASELDRPRADQEPNYTIDALRRLREDLRLEDPASVNIELLAIVGADAFLDLRRWREPEALLEAAEWIIVSRPGFSLGSFLSLGLTFEQRRRVHLLEGVHEPVSASVVRERLQAGLDCSALLTPAVFDYIREHRLYHVDA